MSENQPSAMDVDGRGRYEIRVRGRVDRRWSDWLDGLDFAYEDDGVTSLTGLLADQAALHGVLNRLRDLGLLIISVRLVDAE
jgi:hypothetical protein